MAGRDDAIIVDLQFEKQVHNFACHAAVTQAVIKHYNPDRKNTQNAICSRYTDSKGMQDPIDVLGSHEGGEGLIAKTIRKSTIALNIVKTEINNNRPIIVKVGHHYIALVGYKPIGEKNAILYFLDPINGNTLIKLESGQDGFGKGFRTKYPTKDNPDGEEAVYPVKGFYLTQQNPGKLPLIPLKGDRNRSRSRSRSRSRERASSRNRRHNNIPDHLRRGLEYTRRRESNRTRRNTRNRPYQGPINS